MPYKTTDIILASYLMCAGFTMSGITKNGNKGTFVFGGNDDISEDLLDQYFLGQALCDPIKLNNNVKMLTTAVRRHKE